MDEGKLRIFLMRIFYLKSGCAVKNGGSNVEQQKISEVKGGLKYEDGISFRV